MIRRFRLGKWRFTFTVAPVADVVGVNSLMRNGNHILMWDFDQSLLEDATRWLEYSQEKHHLPNIYLLRSSNPNNYIAYCLCACDWWDAKRIIADTYGVDEQFFKYGVYRDYFTLRVSAKEGQRPTLVAILPSKVPETANIHDLDSWVVYETVLTH